MIDLSVSSGLPLGLDEENRLVFGEGLAEVVPSSRRTTDMADLWYQPDKVQDMEIYFMYRDVHMSEHEEAIRSHNMRYDVTVILPGKVGREYIKTAGHYHPIKPGTRVTYPEVYEVLFGTAHYLLQKADADSGDIVDAVLIEVEAGQQALIPSGYGHITINPSDEPLVMANWVAADFTSEYGGITRYRGGAYFEIYEGGGASRFIPNKRHEGLSPLRSLEPRDLPTFGLIAGRPIYQAFFESPDRFRWLTEPERYTDEFEFIMAPVDR